MTQRRVLALVGQRDAWEGGGGQEQASGTPTSLQPPARMSCCFGGPYSLIRLPRNKRQKGLRRTKGAQRQGPCNSKAVRTTSASKDGIAPGQTMSTGIRSRTVGEPMCGLLTAEPSAHGPLSKQPPPPEMVLSAPSPPPSPSLPPQTREGPVPSDEFALEEPSETVTKLTFCYSTKEWQAERVEVVVEPRPFAEGSMRIAYRMLDLSCPKVPGTPPPPGPGGPATKAQTCVCSGDSQPLTCWLRQRGFALTHGLTMPRSEEAQRHMPLLSPTPPPPPSHTAYPDRRFVPPPPSYLTPPPSISDPAPLISDTPLLHI